LHGIKKRKQLYGTPSDIQLSPNDNTASKENQILLQRTIDLTEQHNL